MRNKIPFTLEQIKELTKIHPTPFHVYDEVGIVSTAKEFNEAFSWVPGRFQNFFAVKALPNPAILDLLRQEAGFGADCSSMPELALAKAAGITGENIMFTSNDTPDEEFVAAKKMGAIMNLDDIGHIPVLRDAAGIPELISFRYNPGPLRDGNEIIGNPEDAKYGVPDDKIVEAFKLARENGAKRFGLHTMICSNSKEEEYLIETARMQFAIARRLKDEAGINLEFVNLGGGVGIPYTPEDNKINMQKFGDGVREAYEKMIMGTDLHPLRVVMESGRGITGPHGWLVTTVRHVAEKYKTFVGVDACMANLMRPALYDSHHAIAILGREGEEETETYNITGSLCENNDQFAKGRKFPPMKRGDILAIENTGAHGWAMGFNYNGKLRSAEFLLKPDGTFEQIRRAETQEDYFATLDKSKYAYRLGI